MEIAIIIATYQRKDGTTPDFLTKALNSIKNQTYSNYKVFLIGDKYEDNTEFIELSKIIDEDKIVAINLEHAVEREKYESYPTILWTCGGANAMNVGINLALEEGFDFIAHLDHDDFWEKNHLEEINKVIENYDNVSYIYTQSNFIKGSILPPPPTNGNVEFALPKDSGLIHSSTCINFRILEGRYRDVFSETGKPYPSDADLWNRLATEITNKKLNSFLIRKITCTHDLEQH